jgi:flagellin
LTSDKKFTVQAGKSGLVNLEALGFRQGTYGGSDNGTKIKEIDISTISGATIALNAIDAAIDTVSRSQAKSGALNNRLDSVINNLTESIQNITASRSRIMDTDYAVETTSLAKQQIISQAATAMLAQANQQGQSVLSLLK